MTMKRAVVLIVVAVVVMAVLAGVVTANTKSGKAKPEHAGAAFCARGERLWDALGLTEDQKTRIKGIIASYKPQMKAIWDDPALPIEQKKAQLRELRQKMRADIMAILTPEQQKKLEELKAAWPHKHGRHGFFGRFRFALHKLNLTDDQKAKIHSIFASHRDELKAIRQNPNLTPEQKKEKFKEVFTGIINEIRQVLTPEQQQQLDELLNQKAAERPVKTRARTS